MVLGDAFNREETDIMGFKTSILAAVAVVAGSLQAGATVHRFEPGPDIQLELQEALILAEPGDTIELAEGVYELTMQLSLDVENVTVRGQGMYKTILDFSKQDSGSEGLYVTSDKVTLEDFAIVDAKGNCFKSNGANDLRLIRIRAEWTGGPDENNGAYGLYPVSCENVLIDGCIAIGASDAGIYVGQTKNVIVRNSRAEYNVAGIEIENCHYADVYDNVATNNTGGILVFDLPGLPMQNGQHVRVFNNRVYDNNTPNFAPEGNIVGKVPTGTGVMVMANSRVHVYDNDIKDHATSNVIITSYGVAGEPVTDPNYYPYPEGVYVHGNRFGKVGYKPGGEIGQMIALMTGVPIPDIIWDGVINEEKLVDGEMPAEYRIYIGENEKVDGGEEVTFANVDAKTAMERPLEARVSRDITAHAGSLEPLAPVDLSHLED